MDSEEHRGSAPLSPGDSRAPGDPPGGAHPPAAGAGGSPRDRLETAAEGAGKALGPLCAALAVALAISLSATTFNSTDGPALIRFGMLALEQGRFARFGDYAAPSDANDPHALHHQWLLEPVSAAAWSLLGERGVWLLQAAVLLSVMLFLFLAARGRTPLWVPAAAAAAMLIALTPRILLRGDFASLAFLAAELYVLRSAAERGKWTRAWWVVPITLLWINCHPMAAFGIGMAVLCACEEAIRPFLDRKPFMTSLRERRHLFAAVALAAASTALTPYGPGLVLVWAGAMAPSAEGADVMKSVAEFAPLADFFDTIFLLAFKALAACAAAIFLLTARKTRFWPMLAFAACAAMSFMHFRMIGFASVAAAFLIVFSAPNLASSAARLRWFTPLRLKIASAAAAAATALCVSLTASDAFGGGLFLRNFDLRRFGETQGNLHFPWRAVEFVKEKGLEGNCFNNYDIGSFLALALPHGNRIVIDTQFLYTREFYFEYGNVMEAKAPIAPWIAKYSIGFVMLKPSSGEIMEVFRLLYADPEWRLVFIDEGGAVFVLAGHPNWARSGCKAIDLDKADPESLVSRGRDSRPEDMAAMADFLVRAGRPERAMGLYLTALEREPGLVTAWNNLGVILMNRGEARGAFRCFEEAVKVNGRYGKPRKNLRRLLDSGMLAPGSEEARTAEELGR